MSQQMKTPLGKDNSYKSNEAHFTNSQEGNTGKDRQALRRIEDFMADPGPMPFRHKTVADAQRYMADKLKEFDHEFGK